jgi:hypothetical protein
MSHDCAPMFPKCIAIEPRYCAGIDYLHDSLSQIALFPTWVILRACEITIHLDDHSGQWHEYEPAIYYACIGEVGLGR